MKVLLLDNFDSFTYNIAHYLEALGAELTIVDNRSVVLSQITSFDALVLSPGPGLPKESGKLLLAIDCAVTSGIPILGICLGMQAIAVFFGGSLYNQQRVKHGVSEEINVVADSVLFEGCPTHFKVGLYHSWAVDLMNAIGLKETAFSENSICMACEHDRLPVFGVQFHPESVLSEHGMLLFQNFLNHVAKNKRSDSIS